MNNILQYNIHSRSFNPFLYWWLLKTYFGKQWRPRSWDEMLHYAAFHLGLHYYTETKRSSEKEIYFLLGKYNLWSQGPQYIQWTIPSLLYQSRGKIPLVHKGLVELILTVHKWATAWDFQQCGILTCVDSDEHLQPPFKLRNSKWCSVSSLPIIEHWSG